MGTGPLRLASLHVYPVKSCAGLAVESVVVGRRGLEGDRRWMVVDERGRFVSQRTRPRLALIRPEPREGGLALTARGMPALEIGGDGDGPRLEVGVWRDRCRAIDEGDEAAAWLARFLGSPVRLVRQAPDEVRRVDPAYARSEGDEVSFADAYPLLLATRASLDDLNCRLPEPVPMNRFRPNLVIGGGLPWAEDGWREMRIGEVAFDVVKPCARCATTTVDQTTGRKGKEPLRTLASFRRGVPGAPPGDAGAVYFGQNLIHRGPGRLEVGAEVETG